MTIDKAPERVVQFRTKKKGNNGMAEYDKIKYNMEYNAKNYDRINIAVAKGVKADWASRAKAAGMSLNAYITRAVDEYAGISPDADRIAEKAREEARREVLAKIDQALRGEKQSEPKSTETTFDEEIKKKLEGLI